jgi:hypothetical protein
VTRAQQRTPRKAEGLLSAPIVIGLVGGLLATLLFFWIAAEGSAVPEKPHHVPVAVVGPTHAVEELATMLQHDGAFKVIAEGSDGRAIKLAGRRGADAIVDLYNHELQTVPAASTLTPIVLEHIFSSPDSPVHLREVAVTPLAAGDPNGMGLMLFLPLASVLGGLPAGLALALLTKPRRPRSLVEAGMRLARMVVYAGLLALFLALLADGILGYGGSQMLTIWGWSTLLVAACMACAEAFVSALSLVGFALAAIPLLFFGIPSVPWPTPANWQSGVFRILGPYDPVAATADGVRNGVFFGSADPTKDVLVLAIWIIVPVLLMLTLGVQSQARGSEPGGGREKGGYRQTAVASVSES